MPVNVSRFFHDDEILVIDGGWRTKNRFHLLFRHSFLDFVNISLGDAFFAARILRQVMEKLPSGPINVADWKNMTPPKSHVMTKMEELIHHFIVVTEGLKAPPGEIYFAAENPKGELGFYINSKGGGVPHRLKIRAPSFVNLSILPELLPGCMVSDVPAVLGSLDFVMGECDR